MLKGEQDELKRPGRETEGEGGHGYRGRRGKGRRGRTRSRQEGKVRQWKGKGERGGEEQGWGERKWEGKEHNIVDNWRRGRDGTEDWNSKDGGVGNCFFRCKGMWSHGRR